MAFQWNQNSEAIGLTPGTEQIGLVAQEVEFMFPQLVSTSQEGYKSVDYTKLTAVLIEAVKELKKANNKLMIESREMQRRIVALENSNR